MYRAINNSVSLILFLVVLGGSCPASQLGSPYLQNSKAIVRTAVLLLQLVYLDICPQLIGDFRQKI